MIDTPPEHAKSGANDTRAFHDRAKAFDARQAVNNSLVTAVSTPGFIAIREELS